MGIVEEREGTIGEREGNERGTKGERKGNERERNENGGNERE